MRGHDQRDIALVVEPRQQRRNLQLKPEIERNRRLVEQQDAGRLRQRAGDDHPLFLAAAQRGKPACFERRRAGGRKRLARDPQVVDSFDFEPAEMRVAAHEHNLDRAEIERRVRLLRHHRDQAGQLAP